MRALDLEFQPQRRSNALGWSLLSVGLVMSLSMAAGAHWLADQAEQLKGELSHAQRTLQVHTSTAAGGSTGLTSAQQREQDARLAEMKQVSAQLRRPWERLFAALETLRGDDIALLALSPDARKGQLRISAEARNLEAMLAFHKSLEDSPELNDVSLLNHEIVANSPQKPVLFNMMATWEVNDVRP